MKNTHTEEVILDFCRHHCIVCGERIVVFCGTPIIKIGGCCSGVQDDKTKTFHCITVSSHYHCYKKAKGKVKTRWTLNEVKKIMKEKKSVFK